MSDEEAVSSNNPMDVDIVSSSSPVPTSSTVMLDLGIGSGYISGSDDEQIKDSTRSTPDSSSLPPSVTRKPTTTKKATLTKTKSALVNYERDSDDDEPSEDEMDDDEQEEENDSNSQTEFVSHPTGDVDPNDRNTFNEQITLTSDLLTGTSFKADEASPSSRGDLTPSHQLIFPEDAEIRIPPLPTESCSADLERKFDGYYKHLKKTGVDQNAAIQKRKDFRNPCMYEKMIAHFGIDEIGTNFPQDLYDPHWWGKESYYEELGKAQKNEMDRREKERRERTKIGFTPGVKKVDQLGGSSSNSAEPVVEKRKNRFDQ